MNWFVAFIIFQRIEKCMQLRVMRHAVKGIPSMMIYDDRTYSSKSEPLFKCSTVFQEGFSIFDHENLLGGQIIYLFGRATYLPWQEYTGTTSP